MPLQTNGDALIQDINRANSEFLICKFAPFHWCQLWAEPMVGGSPHRVGNLGANWAAATITLSATTGNAPIGRP